MKKITFLRVLAVVLFTAGMMQPLFAVDVYLAPPPIGNDGTGNGTIGAPYATLAMAYSKMPSSGDPTANTIFLTGIIDITQEVTPPIGVNLKATKFCTIDGGDAATSGFDGKDVTQLIDLNGNKGAVIFKNLTFKNAFAAIAANGGTGNDLAAVVKIVNAGTFSFENCIFSANRNLGNANSASIHISNSADPTNVSFDNCKFFNNSGAAGGAIWMGDRAVVSIKNSYFYNNTVTDRGGAIYMKSTSKCTIEATKISDNTATKMGGAIFQAEKAIITLINDTIEGNKLIETNNGGAIYLDNPNGFTVDKCIIRGNNSPQFGGAIYIKGADAANNTSISIKNSLIANNIAKNSGGGIYINDTDNSRKIDVSLINTTITGNKVENSQHGGGIFVSGNSTNKGSTLTMINCTVTENLTWGNNTGFGCGLSVRAADQTFKVSIANSIFEGNFVLPSGTGTPIYNDIAFSGGSGTVQQFLPGENAFIYNSIISTSISMAGPASPPVPSLTSDNKVNYGQTNWSGLNCTIGNPTSYSAQVAAFGYIPLTPTANARDFGKAKYLLDLKILTDQTGAVRKNLARGKVDVGAVEYDKPYVIKDEAGTSTDYKSDAFSDIIFAENDDFTVDAGDDVASFAYGVKFKKTFEPGKWYAMGFPFDVIGFYCEAFEYGKPDDDGAGPILEIYNGDGTPGSGTVGDFFVKKFVDEGGDAYHFEFVDKIEAGEGYIISFPNDFAGKEITFVSDFNPLLTNDNHIAAITSGEYKLLANPSVATTAPESLQSNFYYYTLNGGTNEFERTTADVAPFEAFIAVTGISNEGLLKSIALENTPTDIRAIENKGKLIATKYYNLQGMEVAQPQKGNVYLLKKIYESGNSKVIKQIVK